ncbi:MAG: 50S ribosomal protein L10 [Planctomycetes bacterium]|nr:50S ribosomal protein L10 [Planctomycetota bacterium]
MSKYIKELLQKELEEKFADVDDFLVVATKGVDGNTNNEMRGILKEKGIRLAVVKNAMMRRAMDKLGRSSSVELFTSGPCTVAYGGDSVVDVAKELAVWVKKTGAVEVRGAYVDGAALGTAAAELLAKMKSRSELQGEVLMLAMSPGRRVAGAIVGPGGIVAGCVKGLIEKLEDAA